MCRQRRTTSQKKATIVDHMTQGSYTYKYDRYNLIPRQGRNFDKTNGTGRIHPWDAPHQQYGRQSQLPMVNGTAASRQKRQNMQAPRHSYYHMVHPGLELTRETAFTD